MSAHFKIFIILFVCNNYEINAGLHVQMCLLMVSCLPVGKIWYLCAIVVCSAGP
jgi:hypothetical protein